MVLQPPHVATKPAPLFARLAAPTEPDCPVCRGLLHLVLRHHDGPPVALPFHHERRGLGTRRPHRGGQLLQPPGTGRPHRPLGGSETRLSGRARHAVCQRFRSNGYPLGRPSRRHRTTAHEPHHCPKGMDGLLARRTAPRPLPHGSGSPAGTSDDQRDRHAGHGMGAGRSHRQTPLLCRPRADGGRRGEGLPHLGAHCAGRPVRDGRPGI